MKKRLVRVCLIIILVIVFIVGVLQRNTTKELTFDFKTDYVSKLLNISVRELPFLTRAHNNLDYLSIEYGATNDNFDVDSIEFGFSYYAGFDLYVATTVTYVDNHLTVTGMVEEAKTIYDDLYLEKAPIGDSTGALKGFLANCDATLYEFVEEILQQKLEFSQYCISKDEGQSLIVIANS